MPVNNSENIKNNAIKNFIWKFAERVCAQAVSLIVSIILARILMPDDYAIISVVTIFFAFCNILISGGLNAALIQKKDADILDYSTILYSSVLVSIVLYGVMFFCAPIIANIYNSELLVPIIRVMSLTLIVNAVKSVLSAYTSSNLQFKKFFISTIIGTVISAVIGISMAINGFGVWSLVAQQMSNSFIDTIVLFFTTRIKFKVAFSFRRFKELFKYAWKIFVASIINVLYEEINPLIIGVKYSGTDMSFYTKGKSFPSLLNTTISQTLSSVLFPVMSKVQDDKRRILNITRRYIKTSSYIIFPMMIGFFSVSESFVKLLLTEKWLPAVPYIQIFCISYMFNLIQTGNLEAIKAIGRSDITLILEIIKKSAYFVVIGIFVFVTNDPISLAFTSIICTGIATLVNTFPNRKLIGYRYIYQVMDILPNLIISIIMGIVVFLMNDLPLNSYLLLPLQIAVGMTIYIVLSIICKNENFVYILDTIKQRSGNKRV